MLEPGAQLNSRFTIQSLIGRGGMGAVYAATQPDGRTVAIKELELPNVNAEEYRLGVQQVTKEASILRQLQHPNIPRVLDFFETGGRFYIVMEFVQGQSLDKLVATEPLSEPVLLRYGRALASVLDYLHTHDPPIIFRDLKPSNVMVTTDGQIKLIDFGIAKAFDTATGLGTHTSVRGAGTPGFAAPEQYGTGTDARTDIYALGVTMYSLLTRMVPPASTELASGSATVTPLLSIRPDVSTNTARTIEWMMKVNRKERPPSVREVAQAMGWTLPVAAALRQAVAPVSTRRPAWVFFLAGLLVLGLVGGGGWFWFGRTPTGAAFEGDGQAVPGQRIGVVRLQAEAGALREAYHLQPLEETDEGPDIWTTRSLEPGLRIQGAAHVVDRIIAFVGPDAPPADVRFKGSVQLGARDAQKSIKAALGPPSINTVEAHHPERHYLGFAKVGIGFTVDFKQDKILAIHVFRPRL